MKPKIGRFPSSSSHRYTQVSAGVWEPLQLVEVRLCLTVRQSLTSIVGAFPIPAGITSFGCPHILVYNDESSSFLFIFITFESLCLEAVTGSCRIFVYISRDDSLGKPELPRLVYQAGAWETAELLTNS